MALNALFAKQVDGAVCGARQSVRTPKVNILVDFIYCIFIQYYALRDFSTRHSNMQSLSDLVDSFHLYAVCEACQRQTKLNIDALILRLGGDAKVHKMRSKLKCRGCDTHTEDLRIVYVGKKDQEAIFQYRR